MPKLDYILKELMKTIRPVPLHDINFVSHVPLYEKIVELCEKAKLPLPIHMCTVEDTFGLPNAMMAKLTNGSDALFLSEGLLKTFGYNLETNPLVSKELEAIIAHELGHHSKKGKDVAALMIPQFAGPALAVAGYNIYEYAKHRKAEKKEGSINQHIEIVSKDIEHKAGEIINKSNDKPEEKGLFHTAKKIVIWSAKNMAVAMAGSFAVVPITKVIGRRVEFAADKFGANLVGAEHMANALHMLEKRMTEIMDAAGVPKFYKTINQLMDYHPSTASRVKNLGL